MASWWLVSVLLFSVALANEDEDPSLFEGDIVLTDEQRAAVEGARGSITQKLWPGGVVVYELDPRFERSSRAMEKLTQAISDYEKYTCIRFRKKTANDNDYVYIKDRGGCRSHVGRKGGKQYLSLSSGCWHKGTIIHELGHALGFFHEQTRPDRDDYVTILFENIRLGMASNFMKHSAGEVDSLGTPYDYGSIMHYGPKIFSANGKPTIVAKKPGVKFGQRDGLSPIDIKQVNLLYKCSGGVRPPVTKPPVTQAPVTEKPVTRPPPVTDRPMTLPPSGGAKDFFCDFDHGTCGFVQSSSDNFNWIRNTGSTSTQNTGPSSDTSGIGHYMYIETSKGRQGYTARLEKRGVVLDGDRCLEFYYHMYGVSTGELRVKLGDTEIWSKKGDQGDQWNKANIQIKDVGANSLVFEGVRGLSFTGDIAIDDIRLTSCSAKPTIPPVGSCGVSHHARIVGGTTAQQGGWPWQAQLRTSTGYPYCGGTLIHPEWVLTATHCLKGETASRVHIRLGAHRRTKGSGNEQDFRVIRLVTHPNYHRPVGYANDIALLKLDRPAKLDRYVNFACLPDQVPEPKEGDRCYITGWGKLSSHGSAPDILQQATVPVVGRARCMKAYRGQIHESMLCAGLDAGGVDACQGDSGGPMVCENAGRFYIQGATSWGNGCAAPGKFGVYARVKYVLDWIKSEMARP